MVDLKTSFLIGIVVIFGYTKDILAARCSFITPEGVRQFRYCDHQCCEGSSRNASTVCCSYEYDSLYTGVRVSSLVLSALIVFFCVYFCFKHKRDDRNRREFRIIYRRQSSNATTATDDALQHEIPSVSFDVSSMLPPPYEVLPPPPYYTDFRKTSYKGEHNDAFDPGEQPPAYTSHQTIQ